MINVMHSNAVYKPNFCFHGERKKFHMNPMRSPADPVTGNMWSGDILYLSGGSPLIQKAMASDMIVKNKKRLVKLEEVRRLIVSGKYKIDAEKLAEKMLKNMAGLLMAN